MDSYPWPNIPSVVFLFSQWIAKVTALACSTRRVLNNILQGAQRLHPWPKLLPVTSMLSSVSLNNNLGQITPGSLLMHPNICPWCNVGISSPLSKSFPAIIGSVARVRPYPPLLWRDKFRGRQLFTCLHFKPNSIFPLWSLGAIQLCERQNSYDLFSSYEGPQGVSNGLDHWGVFRDAQGWVSVYWLVRELHQFKASTAIDPGTSISTCFYMTDGLGNMGLLIITHRSVICPLCCW